MFDELVQVFGGCFSGCFVGFDVEWWYFEDLWIGIVDCGVQFFGFGVQKQNEVIVFVGVNFGDDFLVVLVFESIVEFFVEVNVFFGWDVFGVVVGEVVVCIDGCEVGVCGDCVGVEIEIEVESFEYVVFDVCFGMLWVVVEEVQVFGVIVGCDVWSDGQKLFEC